MDSTIRFLLDENVNQPDHIIELCEEAGLPVARVHQLNLHSTDDEIIFERAMEEGYIVVTANVRDFRSLQTEWAASGEEFPGVVYLPASRYRNVYRIVQTLINVSSNYTAGGEWWVR